MLCSPIVMFAPRSSNRGGDYVLPVKENQPTLLADIQAAFAEPPAGLSPPPECTPSRELRPGL